MASSDTDSNDPQVQLAVLQEKLRSTEEMASEKLHLQEQARDRALADLNRREADLKQATEAINELNADHHQEISRLNADHHREISQLRDEHSKTISRLNADHDRKISKANALYNKKIRRLKAYHRRKINGSNIAYNKEISKLNADCSRLQTDLEVTRTELAHARESLARKNKDEKIQALVGSLVVFVASLFGSVGVNLLTSAHPDLLLAWLWLVAAGVVAIGAACIPLFFPLGGEKL